MLGKKDYSIKIPFTEDHVRLYYLSDNYDLDFEYLSYTYDKIYKNIFNIFYIFTNKKLIFPNKNTATVPDTLHRQNFPAIYFDLHIFQHHFPILIVPQNICRSSYFPTIVFDLHMFQQHIL